ncbi:MAG: hypothetical protein ACE10G_11300 [Gemmatimonadales bacterium]|jgi:hypothetical protein
MPTLNPPPGFTGEFHTDLAARAAYSEGAGADRDRSVTTSGG